jgi:hypothetical protein
MALLVAQASSLCQVNVSAGPGTVKHGILDPGCGQPITLDPHQDYSFAISWGRWKEKKIIIAVERETIFF